MCEAQIAAFEATGETSFRDRALLLADNICRRQTSATDGLIWEHFDSGWQVDWDYNRDDPKNLFRPWGFQIGHQTEWAKLLLTLDLHLDGSKERPDWLLKTARTIFDRALKIGWDERYGGLIYCVAPVGVGAVGRTLADARFVTCDEDKYFWVCAESIAAAVRLALATDAEEYWFVYDRLWSYADAHLIDHRYGAWYRILDREGRRYSDEKSPAGKTDYHTMGACHDVLAALRAATHPLT